MIVETRESSFTQVLLNHVVTYEDGVSWEVSTCRFPYAYEFGYEQVMLRNTMFRVPGHYETMIFRAKNGKRVSSEDYGHARYESEEEAIRHHNLILELMCNRAAHPRKSEMDDAGSWTSPWVEKVLQSSMPKTKVEK